MINIVACFEWENYFNNEDCLRESLMNNGWALEKDISEIEPVKQKELLIEKLNQFYDGNIHSQMDLSMRPETGDKGSLCGMAAMYQAGVSTILSVSEIKQMSYDDVKEKIALVVGTAPDNIKKQKDKTLLRTFYEYVCESNNQAGRRKRELLISENFDTSTRSKRQTVESDEEIELRSYGSQLRYECGLARMFYDTENEEHYQERWMQCNWNQTWTLTDQLDDCVWVQCLYPPDPPPEAQLMSTWSGDPVEFHANVSYVCASEDLYFEWDRDMPEYNISCLPGGSWDEPLEWPVCFDCKYILCKFVLISFHSC